MFGKLLKYEFKSTAKWYLLITLIALGFVSDYRLLVEVLQTVLWEYGKPIVCKS